MTYLDKLNELIVQGEGLLNVNFKKNIPKLKRWKADGIRFVENLFEKGSTDAERLKNRNYGYEDNFKQVSYGKAKKEIRENIMTTIEELKGMKDYAIDKDNNKKTLKKEKCIEKIPIYISLLEFIRTIL